MGRLIDCNDVYNAIQITTDNFGAIKGVVESNMLTMLSKIETVEAIPKDQYDAKLKTDMVAMLTEIQLEIEKVPKYRMTYDSTCVYRKAEEYIADINNIIQQKINALKE